MADNSFEEMGKQMPVLGGLFRSLGKNLIFRGVLELLLGILLLLNPLQTTAMLTIVIGAFLIMDGIGILIAGIRHSGAGKAWLITNAAALALLGLVAVLRPILMDTMWVLVIGVWQIFGGIECLAGGGWRRGWNVASGVLSLILGVIFICAPFAGLLSVIWLLGILLISSGVVTVAAGVQLRSAGGKH